MDPELLITLAVAILGSNWLGTAIMRLIDRKRKRKTPQEQMVLAIGRDRLLFLSQKYEKLGYIPEDEFETYEAMGKAYIAMDGNSRVRRHYETDVATLQIK